jgi:hypothetical protein
MSKCKYCGENAGFLKIKHQVCENKYNAGVDKVKTEIIDVFNEAGFLAKLERYIAE